MKNSQNVFFFIWQLLLQNFIFLHFLENVTFYLVYEIGSFGNNSVNLEWRLTPGELYLDCLAGFPVFQVLEKFWVVQFIGETLSNFRQDPIT